MDFENKKPGPVSGPCFSKCVARQLLSGIGVKRVMVFHIKKMTEGAKSQFALNGSEKSGASKQNCFIRLQSNQEERRRLRGRILILPRSARSKLVDEIIFIGRMTVNCKFKASRDGSK